MADETYLKLKSPVAVPFAGGRTAAKDTGDVVLLQDLDAHFQERWEEGDPWLTNLFEEAGGAAEEADLRNAADTRPYAAAVVDKLTYERAQIPVHLRLGGAGLNVDRDMFRTLPRDGADLSGDERFKETEGADTSEKLEDHGDVAVEPPTGTDHLPVADGAPRAVDESEINETDDPLGAGQMPTRTGRGPDGSEGGSEETSETEGSESDPET